MAGRATFIAAASIPATPDPRTTATRIHLPRGRNRDARDGVRHAAHLLSLGSIAERSAGTFKRLSK
jgi:hypothetical protein